MAPSAASERVAAIPEGARRTADELVGRARRDAHAMTTSAETVLEEMTRRLRDQADAIDAEVKALYGAASGVSAALHESAARLAQTAEAKPDGLPAPQRPEPVAELGEPGSDGHVEPADPSGPRAVALNPLLHGAEPDEVRRLLEQDLGVDEGEPVVEELLSRLYGKEAPTNSKPS
jgi:hypothetical protein